MDVTYGRMDERTDGRTQRTDGRMDGKWMDGDGLKDGRSDVRPD